MKFKIIGILILVATSGFTALGQYSKKDKKFFPKISPDAKVVLDLSSNIQNTRFVIDGKEVMKTKRIKVLINKGQHTVVATPDGYISKEDYLQPPYFNDQATLRFTFLLEDKIEMQDDRNPQRSSICARHGDSVAKIQAFYVVSTISDYLVCDLK